MSVLSAVSLLVACVQPAQASEVAARCVIGDGLVAVDLGGAPFTTLRWEGLSRPVLWPVQTAGGQELTRAWPLRDEEGDPTDHVHQKSLWFAHGDVNGVDFWTEGDKAGRIVKDTVEVETLAERVVVRMRCRWLGPDGRPVCSDAREITLREDRDGGDRLRSIDYAVTLDASHGALHLGDTKEGTMAARVARGLCFDRADATGHALTSEGLRDGAAWGKRARWVAYHGVVDGRTVGIALLDHPANLRHPTTWHARPYGLLAANPFGLHEFEKAEKGAGAVKIEAGTSLTLRYRFVLFSGAADAARLDAQWRAFGSAGAAPAGSKR